MNTCILLRRLEGNHSSRAALRLAQSRLAHQLASQAAMRLCPQVTPDFKPGTTWPLQWHHPELDAALGVSIAHRGPWVAAAVSYAHPLGLDLELMVPRNAPSALDWLLSADERHWLAQQWPQFDELHRFYLAWTAKEAVGKRQGLGWETPGLEVWALRGHLAHCCPAPDLLLAVASDTPLQCQIQVFDSTPAGLEWRPWPVTLV